MRTCNGGTLHLTPNKQLVEHAENVVTKARADVEAFVLAKARQLVEIAEPAGR